MIGWAERRIARERGAAEFLRARGFSVTRTGGGEAVPRFWLSGWSGELTGSQLVEIAETHGFADEPPPSAAPPPPNPNPPDPNPEPEENTMPEQRKPITFTATGEVLDRINALVAARDLTFGGAAVALIEQAIAAEDADPARLDTAAAQAAAEPADTGELLRAVGVVDLIAELRHRFSAGAVTDPHELEEAVARADAAEARIRDVEGKLALIGGVISGHVQPAGAA